MTRQSPDIVADDLWARVRKLVRTADALSDAERLDELDTDGQARLDRVRVRLGRAVERAELADRLADELHGIESRRANTTSP